MRNVFGLAVLGVFGSAVLCINVRANVSRPLHDIFLSVLPEVKAKTRLPVLLPTELPAPFSDAKDATVDKASANEYAVSLYYKVEAGNAGFAAGFTAQNDPNYSPRELPNVRAVTLAAGMVGFFRPVGCSGSCAPANILVGTGTDPISDSTESAFFSHRKEAAKDRNNRCQLGNPCRPTLVS